MFEIVNIADADLNLGEVLAKFDFEEEASDVASEVEVGQFGYAVRRTEDGAVDMGGGFGRIFDENAFMWVDA